MPDPTKKKNLKNKNIVNTKLKNVVPMIKKKVNQKIKNIKNSTPKEIVGKVKRNVIGLVKNNPNVKLVRKVVNKVKSYRDSNPLSKSPKPNMMKKGNSIGVSERKGAGAIANKIVSGKNGKSPAQKLKADYDKLKKVKAPKYNKKK